MARKSKLSHTKEAFYIMCILVVLLVAFLGYLGPGGYIELRKMQAELTTHRARVDALEKENAERIRTIELLKEDSETQERFARQEGYVRSNELMLTIDPKPPEPAPAGKKLR